MILSWIESWLLEKIFKSLKEWIKNVLYFEYELEYVNS